jgi:hypothetical protein
MANGNGNGKWHVVGPEQDLLFLAEWFYGDSAAWSHIFWANLDVYGDDFEKIPAGSTVFIPELEQSPVKKMYTGPAIKVKRQAEFPVRTGPAHGSFRFEEKATGYKCLIFVFEGTGQGVTD